MAQKVGKCRFCGQTKKLVDSHIVPQALHKDAQAEDAQADEETINIYSNSHAWSKKSLTGVYGQFLCHDCECHVGQDDQCGIEFVRKYRDGRTGEPLQGSFKKGFIADVDYTHIKLWIMSMLWRADACDQDLYKKVDLGEKWRKRLTDSIRSRDPGGTDDFAVFATLFDEEGYGQGFMLHPHREQNAGVNWYRFSIYSGFTFFIKVDQRKQPKEFAPLTLREGQPFVVLRRQFSDGELSVLAQIMVDHPPQ